MPKKNIKLKGLHVSEPVVKKQVALKESDSQLFEEYILYLKDETGVDHSHQEIASLMIVNWMEKDTGFRRWRKGSEKKTEQKERVSLEDSDQDNQPERSSSIRDFGQNKDSDLPGWDD